MNNLLLVIASDYNLLKDKHIFKVQHYFYVCVYKFDLLLIINQTEIWIKCLKCILNEEAVISERTL